MATLIDQESQTTSLGQIIGRGFVAVLPVWLLIIAVSILVTPVSLAGQLGFATDFWAVVGLALLYAAALAYTGVLFAGLTMSLYLARRPHAWQLGD